MSGVPSFRKAVGWSFVMTAGQQLTSLIITLVLARILGPEEFGIVAMALVFVAFAQLMVQQGMVPAIVQRPNLRAAHLDTAFIMVGAAAVVLTLALIAAAPLWAAVTDVPDLTEIVWVLSAIIPLRALTVVQEGVLRRASNFRSLAVRTNGAALIGGLVGLAAAVLGAGVWALVIQQLVGAAVEVIALWAMSSWRPGRAWERSAARELFDFTSGSFVASIGTFLNNRGDALFISVFFGPAAVGLYRLAARLVNVVVDVAARAIQQAAMPELARLQGDEQRFVKRSVTVLRTTGLTSLPAFGLLAGLAPLLVRVLGPEWEGVAFPLQLLCITGAVRSVGLVVGAMLQARGRPRSFAVITWSAAVLSTGGFLIAGLALVDADVTAQVEGISLVRAAVFGVPLLALNFFALNRWLGVGPRSVAAALLPSAVAGCIGVAVGAAVWVAVADRPLIVEVAALSVVPLATVVALLVFEPLSRSMVGRILAKVGLRRPAEPTIRPQPPRRDFDPDEAERVLREASVLLSAYGARTTAARGSPGAMTNGGRLGTLADSDPSLPVDDALDPRPSTPSAREERPLALRSHSMDLWETLRIVMRRWMVSLPLLILAVVTALAIPSDVGQQYTSSASMIFLPSNVVVVETADGSDVLDRINSFEDVGGSEAAMALVVQLSLTGQDVRTLVEAEGLEPEYTIVVDRGEPFMEVEVTTSSPALATGTVDYLVDAIQRDLTQRQDQVEAPEADRITIQIISPTSPALASTGAALRVRLGVLVVGLALAVGAALFVEGAANWSRRRQLATTGPSHADAAVRAAAGQPVSRNAADLGRDPARQAPAPVSAEGRSGAYRSADAGSRADFGDPAGPNGANDHVEPSRRAPNGAGSTARGRTRRD